MYRKEKYSKEYKDWRKAVYKRDQYKCRVCDKRGYLNAHHLNAWHWCPESRYDVNNGITLCYSCHNEFHNCYGKKNNTIIQFQEFMESKGRTL